MVLKFKVNILSTDCNGSEISCINIYKFILLIKSTIMKFLCLIQNCQALYKILIYDCSVGKIHVQLQYVGGWVEEWMNWMDGSIDE